MEPHDHNLTEQLIKWSIDHWAWLAGVGSTISGGIAYVLHQRFATISKVETCKEAIIKEFSVKLDSHEKREFEQENLEHGAIKSQIKDLHTKVDNVDGKIDRLKNMMLEMEWKKK